MTPPFERGTPEICAESLYSKSVNYFGPTLYNVDVDILLLKITGN